MKHVALHGVHSSSVKHASNRENSASKNTTKDNKFRSMQPKFTFTHPKSQKSTKEKELVGFYLPKDFVPVAYSEVPRFVGFDRRIQGPRREHLLQRKEK